MKDNKYNLWYALYKKTLEKLQSRFPDYIKESKNWELHEMYDNAAIDVALGFSDIAVYGKYKNVKEINLYESEKILHESGIKTPKIPENTMTEEEITNLIIGRHHNKTMQLSGHGAMLQMSLERETNKTPIMCATDKLLSLREQLSSAIDEIDAVMSKTGQIQQNIFTHEKQADEINQSRKFSDPTL